MIDNFFLRALKFPFRTSTELRILILIYLDGKEEYQLDRNKVCDFLFIKKSVLYKSLNNLVEYNILIKKTKGTNNGSAVYSINNEEWKSDICRKNNKMNSYGIYRDYYFLNILKLNINENRNYKDLKEHINLRVRNLLKTKKQITQEAISYLIHKQIIKINEDPKDVIEYLMSILMYINSIKNYQLDFIKDCLFFYRYYESKDKIFSFLIHIKYILESSGFYEKCNFRNKLSTLIRNHLQKAPQNVTICKPDYLS